MCREKGIDYSACTSVTALLCGEVLSVAHLGDSKIVLGREGPVPGQLQGKYLTTDHKPDMPEERKRIEEVRYSNCYWFGKEGGSKRRRACPLQVLRATPR